MSQETTTATNVKVSTPNMLEEAIKAHLDQMAANDPVFAEKLANPKKSLNECIDYIQGEVYHNYIASGKYKGGCAAVSNDEVFGMAVHYYDEEEVKVRKVGGGRPSTAASVELTEEAKAKLMKAAEERYYAKCEEEVKKREAEKKKREAEKKRQLQEQEEARKQAEGELSLFDQL